MPAPTTVGGQAVIEGVMMRAASGLAVAVRRQSGAIVVKAHNRPLPSERYPILAVPVLRGVATFVEALLSGFDALSFSAEQAELPVEIPSSEDESPVATKGPAEQKPSSAGSKVSMTLTMVLAIGLGVGLFVVLPHVLTLLVGKLFGGLALKSLAFHLTAGGFKLAIFVSYLSLLALLPDVRRVFMYHGAEHKVIAAFEADEPLDVAHAQAHTTFHARCGTSFLLVVVVIAILVFAMVIPLIPGLGEGAQSHLTAILIKIPLLLPIAGLAYELNRWASKHLGNPLVRLLVAPGFLMQRLTTREPTDDMLEVALAALAAARKRAEDKDAAAIEPIAVYRDFADLSSRLV